MLRVAVDGLNLAIDRRGMGRYARTVLEKLSTFQDINLTIVVRRAQDFETIAAESSGAHLPATLAQARREHFDVTWYPWNGIRFELTKASVVTIHDAFAFAYPHPNPIARWRQQAPIRRAVRRASILTTVSKFSANSIATLFEFDAERFTIASPVPAPSWRPVPLKESPPYMLFVGGPEPRKNAELLFSAFAAAFETGPMQLRIVGTLSAADERALLRSGLFYARLFPNDFELRELYAGAIAVLAPSRDEGYGLPAVEAMACGAPVIAADSGGLPEACDGAALLVNPASAGAWQAAMRLVAADVQFRASLVQRSLARAGRIDRTAPGTIIGECLRRAAATAQ